MSNAKEKLEAAFNRLQTLDISPKITNLEKLLQSLYDIKSAYDMIKEEEDGRPQTDT